MQKKLHRRRLSTPNFFLSLHQTSIFIQIIYFSTTIIMKETTANQTASQRLMDLEERYGAHNYHPLPVVLHKGEGIYVWDVDGKK